MRRRTENAKEWQEWELNILYSTQHLTVKTIQREYLWGRTLEAITAKLKSLELFRDSIAWSDAERRECVLLSQECSPKEVASELNRTLAGTLAMYAELSLEIMEEDWAVEKDELMLACLHMTSEEVARFIPRSQSWVKRYRWKKGLKSHQKRPWTIEEKQAILQWPRKTYRQIGKEINRTKGAVRKMKEDMEASGYQFHTSD